MHKFVSCTYKIAVDSSLTNQLISSAVCPSVEKIPVCKQLLTCLYLADETDSRTSYRFKSDSLYLRPPKKVIHFLEKIKVHE